MSMNPERLRKWYERVQRGKQAVLVRIVHERVQGDAMIDQWDCAELSALSPADWGEMVAGAMQEHADALEESARFRVEALAADGRVLSTTPARVECRRAATVDAANAGDATSGNALVAMLIRHLENRERLLQTNMQISMGALGATLGAMRDVINSQQQNLRTAQEQQVQLLHRLEVALSHETAEASEEERTEALARAQAWSRFAELGPQALELALAKLGLGGAGANGAGH